MKLRLFLSLGLLSAAIIAFQLALMQILAIVQWYHFAYMVISVALLGFGAAGTFLALFRKKLLQRIAFILPLLMISCAIAMALVTSVSQLSFTRFDSYLLFSNYSHLGRLLLTYFLFFIPFFLGALSIGLIFDHHVSIIGKIYFTNLLGSGIGGLLLAGLVWLIFPNQLPGIISLLPLSAGIILIPLKNKNSPVSKTGTLYHLSFNKKKVLLVFASAAFIICTWKIIRPPQLQLSEFKDISKTMLLPGAQIKTERTGAYGLIQSVTSPVLRYAPGLSLTAQETAMAEAAIFINGDWRGVISGHNQHNSPFILRYTGFALPYIMAERNNVLVLQSGTGMEVAHAVSNNVKKVVAVDNNAVLLSLLKRELAAGNDSLFYHPSVDVRNTEPRSFLFSDTGHYDLVCLPAAGSFGGSSGLHALQEQFLFTKESFLEMWKRLKVNGAITITAWMDYPARQSLKVLATLAEVLEELKIQQPQNHIAAIRSWATVSFVLTKSELSQQEILNIRKFCNEMQFDPALLPGLRAEERSFYHELQDSSFFLNIDKLLSADRNNLYADYDFNIVPATDNRPYFSQFIRWKALSNLAGYFGNRSIPFFEIGYLLVAVTLVQIVVISFVLIVLPLFRLGWKGKNKLPVLMYFTGIGLGYMFVEIVFIQRFILYFGHPVYSASAVITSMLIFSGLGSYASGYLLRKRNALLIILSAIIVLIVIYSFALTTALQHTVHGNLISKLLIVVVLMAPLAFCMGIPFPAGLQQVARTNANEVPWAWGINGCTSVISTALATIIAVEAGFTMVMLLAAFFYCFPLIVSGRWK